MEHREILELQYVYSIGAVSIYFNFDRNVWVYKRGCGEVSLFHEYLDLDKRKEYDILNDLLKGATIFC